MKTVSQMDGSNAIEDLDKQKMQFRGTLCCVGTVCNDVYHILHQYDWREAMQARLSVLSIQIAAAKSVPRYLSSFLPSWRTGISDLGHLTTPRSSKATDELI